LVFSKRRKESGGGVVDSGKVCNEAVGLLPSVIEKRACLSEQLLVCTSKQDANDGEPFV
jgi:hypothetical protein